MHPRPPLFTLPLAAALAWAACTGDPVDHDFDIKDPGDDTAGTIDTADTDGPPAADDTDPGGDTDAPPPPTVDCDVPSAPGLAGICDLSVNQAEALAPTAPGAALTLRTYQSPPNPPGAYVSDAATGNRGIAGFHGYSTLRVSDLHEVQLDIEHVSGPDMPPAAVAPEISLVVDLECRFGPYAIANVTYENLGQADDLGGGIKRYTVFDTDPKWTVVTGLYDSTGAELILPDADRARTDGTSPGLLTSLAGAYPNACLRNAKSGDLSMPRDAQTSAILLTLGRSTTLVKSEWRVWRVQINDDVHGPP
ncbi:MAG TPA: hypothetical protein PKA64_09465 [Myxococcota bacterium]|nr:hypothetical protein [Myxococcota bacterium]